MKLCMEMTDDLKEMIREEKIFDSLRFIKEDFGIEIKIDETFSTFITKSNRYIPVVNIINKKTNKIIGYIPIITYANTFSINEYTNGLELCNMLRIIVISYLSRGNNNE